MTTEYVFTEAERLLIAEQSRRIAETIPSVEQRGMLQMILRQQGLAGNWCIAPSGVGLVCLDPPTPTCEPGVPMEELKARQAEIIEEVRPEDALTRKEESDVEI